MTRRDYVMLSGALNRATSRAIGLDEKRGVRVAAQEVSHAIAEGNRAFDQPRFLRDAGVETSTDGRS